MTEQTRGAIMIGYFLREFDDGRREDASGFDGHADILWTPRPRTTFALTAGREINEMTLQGEDFVDELFARVTWRQDWTTHFYSKIEVTLARHDFEGTRREDDLVKARLTLSYALSKRWRVRGAIEHDSRDSSSRNFDHDRNTALIGFEASL